MDLERPDAHRQDRGRGLEVGQAEVLRPGEDVIEAGHDRRLDGRDVERELERGTEAHWAALELVGLDRGEAATEVGGDVHEHRRRRQGLVIDADGVVDRLDRRAGLAPAVGKDVELGLELLAALGRVARRTHVGEDLTGPVVDHAGRCVVDVVTAQAEDPGACRSGDLAAGQDRRRVLGVRCPGGDVDPLLGDLLELQVDRGDDLVAAVVHVRAVDRAVGTEHLAERAPHLPHELGSLPLSGDRRDQLDRLLLGDLILGGACACCRSACFASSSGRAPCSGAGRSPTRAGPRA